MTQRWMILAIVLLVTIPSTLYARRIKDKVYLETKNVGKVEFSHFSHLEAVGRNCPTCHNRIFKLITKNNPDFTMTDMEEGKSCGACHNGTTAFPVTGDCATCHGNGDVIYETEAGKATFSHDVHTAAFGCDACHPDTFKAVKGANKASMAEMEKGASCGACHDGSTAFSVKDENTCGSCHEM